MPHCDPCPPATSTFSRKRRSSLSLVATCCVPTGPCHCVLRAQCVHTEVGAVLEAPVSAEGAGRNGSALAGAEGTPKPRGTPAAEQERLESQAFGQRALPPPRTTACKPPGGGHSWLPWALPRHPAQGPGGVGRARSGLRGWQDVGLKVHPGAGFSVSLSLVGRGLRNKP